MTTHENKGYDPSGDVPGAPAGCPPGLEYLTQIDQVLVHQAVELFEAFTDFEGENRFQVKNSMGQQIYYAVEESDFCSRQFCGGRRGFEMRIANNNGTEVMRAKREFKCCAGCCCCACVRSCAFEICMQAPVGTPIGYVVQNCSLIKPYFEIQDEHGEAVLKIKGPCCIWDCCCCEPEFDIETLSGKKVGCVTKQWAGLVKEIFTEADNFGVRFPMDLGVKVKATLLAAVFLINIMYFEKKGKGDGGCCRP